MKNALLALAASLLLPLAATHGAKVGNLRCEYLKDPLGVDVAKTRLSWKLETGDLKPERGNPLGHGSLLIELKKAEPRIKRISTNKTGSEILRRSRSPIRVNSLHSWLKKSPRSWLADDRVEEGGAYLV
jgi:hypothetical protein